MSAGSITKPIILILSLLLSMIASCAVPDLTNGGSEAGNAKVIGAVVFKSGEPASGTIVQCINMKHDPVNDPPLQDSMIDTTDPSGSYSFVVPNPGVYTIQARHPVHGTRMLNTILKVPNDQFVNPTYVLKSPGYIQLFLPDTLDTADAYVFIKGTTMAFPLSITISDSAGRHIILDSVPAGTIPPIYYCKANDTQSIAVISDTIIVLEGDTTEVNAFVFWINYTAENSGLGSNRVEKLFLARNGDIWCCLHSKGVSRFIGKSWKTYDAKNSMLTDSVSDIIQDTRGVMWFATNKGIMSYSGSEWKVFNKNSNGLPSDNVTAFALERDSVLWIGMHEGLASYNIYEDRLVVYDTAITRLPSHAIKDLTVNSDNKVWSVLKEGFAQYDHQTWEFSSTGDIHIVSTDKISSVWIGSGSSLLRVFGGQFFTYNSTDSKILGGWIRDIFSYNPKELFVGTDYGLTMYNFQQWTDYTGERYAPIDKKRISCVMKDATGTVWVGTYENGIIGFGPMVSEYRK